MNTLYQKLFDFFSIEPKDISLYTAALTHASYKNEHQNENIQDYDRLEYIGDSVLDLVIADLLYKQFPNERSGFLSKTRSYFVNGETLSEISQKVNLLDYANLSKGELNNTLDRSKLLEDMFEALLGAVYLDQGYEKAKEIITLIFLPGIKALKPEDLQDPKSHLQEVLQAEGKGKIEYRVILDEGNAQNKHFIVEVVFNGIVLGTGQGSSKKHAEKEAASDALRRRIQ
ncbi:MAG TPA: ribonuclease III [Firmicutes bacterium]|nr:ribonuclease III [Bacillota bacterium]